MHYYLHHYFIDLKKKRLGTLRNLLGIAKLTATQHGLIANSTTLIMCGAEKCAYNTIPNIFSLFSNCMY